MCVIIIAIAAYIYIDMSCDMINCYGIDRQYGNGDHHHTFCELTGQLQRNVRRILNA